MKLSLLITVHNEDVELDHLLTATKDFVEKNDIQVVLLDDYSTNIHTLDLLKKYDNNSKYVIVKHKLDNDFGGHKQFGNEQCKSEYIWQIDADEYPSEFLLDNIIDIIDTNPSIDLFCFPRINIIYGLSEKEILKWGWEISKSSFLVDSKISELNFEQLTFLKKHDFIVKDNKEWIQHNLPLINWGTGDYQGRLYRNSPKIKWDRKLHENIVGYKEYSLLPKEFDYALYHPKTIERQVKQNTFYNEMFTHKENIRQ